MSAQGNVSFWPFASFRGNATIRSLPERSGHSANCAYRTGFMSTRPKRRLRRGRTCFGTACIGLVPNNGKSLLHTFKLYPFYAEFCPIDYINSTAFLITSSETSQYNAVVPICRCPINFWIVFIPIPRSFKRVANVRRPECELVRMPPIS